MTSDAVLCEYTATFLQSRVPRDSHGLSIVIFLQEFRPTWRIFQSHRRSRFEKELRQVGHADLGCLPIDRVFLAFADLKGFLRSEPYQRIVQLVPTLGISTYIQIDQRKPAKCPDGIRAIKK